MPEQATRYDLEDRLIEFAALVIDVAEEIPATRAGNHISGQLIRAGTSPAANYSEAQGGESRNDFVHKLRIAFKELRETRVWLRIVLRRSFLTDRTRVESVLDECEQLIRIFGKAIATAASKQAQRTAAGREAAQNSAPDLSLGT